MRDRFPLLIIGGLLLLGATGWFLVQGARRGGFADTLSTFKSERDGSRGLYLLLAEAGLPVTRDQHDLKVLAGKKNLVILGARFEDEQFDDDDEKAFDGSDGGVDEEKEADDEEFKKRGLNAVRSPKIDVDESKKLLDHVADGATLVYVPASFRDPKFLERLDVGLERTAESLDARTLIPAQPTRYTQGVERVVTKVRAWLVLPGGAVPLLVDDTFDKPVAAMIPYGQGRVILISAPELAMNQNLAVADNAAFWVSLISTVSDTGSVGFDEYHHGFTGERSMGEFASRYGLQYAVAQLLLGVALWALALRRFGANRGIVDERRVGSTDALIATSRLYREGKHTAHASMSILRHLASQLAMKAGVSGRAEPAEICAALEVRGRKDLADQLLAVATAAAHTTSESDVEQVATLAANIRKNLNHQPGKA